MLSWMNTERKTKIIERRDLSVTSLAFFILSFLGWAYETLLVWVMYGEFSDRGFLRLPFCPIYGGVVCVLYLLIGTPKEGWLYRATKRTFRGAKGSLFWEWVVRYLGYFLLAATFATVAELVVGLLFQGAGCELWSYAAYPYNYKGVVCLYVSLFWGVLLTFVMRFPFQWLLQGLEKIPCWLRWTLSVLLGVALSVDFFFCLARL
jgi:uncharacterized membrane protein